VYIDCNCESDTIVKQIPQYITRLAPPIVKGPKFWEWIGILITAIIITFLGTKFYEVLKHRKEKNNNA
jgi:hypothetical protein